MSGQNVIEETETEINEFTQLIDEMNKSTRDIKALYDMIRRLCDKHDDYTLGIAIRKLYGRKY